MTDSNAPSRLDTLENALQRLSQEALTGEARRTLDELIPLAAAVIEENRQLNEQLLAANLSKSKFVSVVTHELRLPMTSIKGYTDLLRTGVVGTLNEQQANFLNVIRNNIERMSALVSDLSDLSHIESGRMKLNPSQARLSSVLDDLLMMMKARFDDRKQTLQVQIPASLPNLLVDSTRLAQVLTALLNNANKYSPEGAQVTIRAAAEGSQVQIEVEDHGWGITPQDAPVVFTQFFRSEDPNIRDQPGWGLNLSVAKHMMELMNGEIGFYDTPGGGTTFWLRAPVYVSEGKAG